MALAVPGLRVGVWTSPDGPSGCTVVLPPEGTLGAVAVRGVAPGTREAAALGPAGKVTLCHAVVLSGGSAFGLAAADGVVSWLEERGVGYPTPAARVPIVGAAIVLDQGTGVPAARPGPAAGRAACEAATGEDPAEGGVGAGTGCTVAKVAGLEHAWRGGQGVATRRDGDLAVGALVVNNAVGELRAEDGTWLARTRAPEDAPRYPRDAAALAAETGLQVPMGGGAAAGGPSTSTVLACVATTARLTKQEAHRVADLAHTGVARAVWPAHTWFDGDAAFCLATGTCQAPLDRVVELAVEVVAEATRRGPLAARGREGVPGLADPPP